MQLLLSITLIPADVPGPKTNEVMMVLFEEGQVSVKIEGWRRITRAAIDQVCPRVRTRQVNDFKGAILGPRSVGEVTRVRGVNPERSKGMGRGSISLER